MICSSCKRDFPETATFCPFCGFEVPRHVTTMMGGLNAQVSDETQVDAEWLSLVDHFEDDAERTREADTTVSGESVVPSPGPRQIIAETVILAEDPEAVDAVDAPFNSTLVNELVREPTGPQTAEIGSIDDFRPWRRHLAKVAVAAAVAIAIGAGAVVGSWLSEQVETRSVSADQAPASIAEPAAEKPDEKPRPEFDVRTSDGTVELRVDGEVVHTVSGTDGSRYETLEERGRSIEVRLDHVAEKSTGSFHARVAGDHWELVYRGDGSDFRILDVTEADARALDGEVDLVAQLLADRLNAAVGHERPNT